MASNQIIVGNVGTVYDGDCEAEAGAQFTAYKELSKNNYGRAGAQNVTWMRHDRPIDSYDPCLDGRDDD